MHREHTIMADTCRHGDTSSWGLSPEIYLVLGLNNVNSMSGGIHGIEGRELSTCPKGTKGLKVVKCTERGEKTWTWFVSQRVERRHFWAQYATKPNGELRGLAELSTVYADECLRRISSVFERKITLKCTSSNTLNDDSLQNKTSHFNYSLDSMIRANASWFLW